MKMKSIIRCYWLLIILLWATATAMAQQAGSLGAWNSTASLANPVEGPAAVAYQGHMYVLGGRTSPSGQQPYLENVVYMSTVNADGTLQPWQSTTPFATGRFLHAAVVDSTNGVLYVIGGATSQSSLTGTVDVQFAHVLPGGVGVWTATTPLPTALSGHSAFVYNGYLYVFGGQDGNGNVLSSYFYAPLNPDGGVGAWGQGHLTLAQNTTYGIGGPRRYLSSFAYNGHLYVSGGLSPWGNVPLGDVQVALVPSSASRYSFLKHGETEDWKAVAAFQTARYFHGTASENRFMYVVGGQTMPGSPPDRADVQFAEMLNDGTLGVWNSATALPSARSTHACLTYGGRIYVIGGDVPTSGATQQTASVLYAAIQSASDTTPPKTQVSPPPGPQPSTSVTVTVTATDIGGSGVAGVRYTVDGSDPLTSPTAKLSPVSSFSVAGMTPMTLRASAYDIAGNVEQPVTANYIGPQTPVPNPVRFHWPVSGRVTQDFYDDYSGMGGGYFSNKSGVRLYKKYGFANIYTGMSFTWPSNTQHSPNDLHRGIDIAAPADTNIHPALAGKATRYDWDKTVLDPKSPLFDFYGNRVVIDHGNEYFTLYAHLASFDGGPLASLKNGNSVYVNINDVIGKVGNTGLVVTHLHFEVRHSSDSGHPPANRDRYAVDAHFIPVSSLVVASGDEISHDYPGLGGTSLSVQQMTSSGLNDVANTTPTVSSSGALVGFRNSPTFHLVNLVTGSIDAESSDGSGTLGNGGLFTAVFSADSAEKAFSSDDANLVAGDTNGVSDVFVWSRDTGVTERVSVSTPGEQANGANFDVAISADGRYVAFTSLATNLVTGDSNGVSDIFVRDRQTGTTVRISVDSSGGQANGPSYSPSLSADGRYVAFVSEASNLVVGGTNGMANIFVHDLQTGATTLISMGLVGANANGPSRQPSISGDGRYVAFESLANNLVPNDSNGFVDVFLYDCGTSTVQRISVGPNGEQGNGHSREPRISSYGLRISFISEASNLVATVTNGLPNVFVASFLPVPTIKVSTSASPSTGGTTSGDGSYVNGANVTVAATANSGYTFSNWTESGTVVSTLSNYQFTVMSDRTLMANFVVSPPPSTVTSVSVSPSTASINPGGTQQFTATVNGTGSPSQSVTWTTNGGSVTASGLYTPPGTIGTYMVTATSVQDGTKSGSASVTVTTAPAPVINAFSATPAAFQPGGSVALAWSVTGTVTNLSISGGVGDVTGQTSKSVSPTGTSDITFTLTASNAGVQTTRSLVVAYRPKDINGDGVTDVTDLARLAQAYGLTTTACDLNGDGIVDDKDLTIFLTGF